MLSNILINDLKKYVNNIYFTSIILSISLSYLTINNALLNVDGILYLKAANAFLTDGYSLAAHYFAIPFYPIIIALISKYTNLSLLTSGYILNTFFHCIITISFLNIFKKFNPSRNQLILALIIIIIFPQFNEYRHYIIRDHGFWAFSLLAINSFLDYIKNYNSNNNINKNIYIYLYYIFFIAAFLFRAEALILAASIPLGLPFIKPNKYKIYNLYKPILYIMVLTSIIAFLLFINNNLSLIYIKKFLHTSLKIDTINQTIDSYKFNILAVNNSIFEQGDASFTNALVLILTGLFFVLLLKYISVFNILLIILSAVFVYYYIKSEKQKPSSNISTNINSDYFTILLFIFALSLTIPALYLYLTFITAGRYFMLSCFILLLTVPYGLELTFKYIKNNISNNYLQSTSYSIITICLLLLTINGLVSFGPSKSYIKHASNWFNKQNYPKHQSFSNNRQLNYYIDIDSTELVNFTAKDVLAYKNNFNIHYFLLKVKGKDKNSINTIYKLQTENKITVLNKFSNRRNDSVYIIKTT